MQPAMEFISPLFLCAALHQKYPSYIWALQKWDLFLGHSPPYGLYRLHQDSIKPLDTLLFIFGVLLLFMVREYYIVQDM